MTKKIISFIASSLLICSCSNLENAKPAGQSAFTYFYGGTGNYRATAALEVADGFLIAGDSVGAAGYGALIIKTDANGKTQWRKVISGATVSSVIATPNGYLLCGDSIKVDLTQVRVMDQTRTRMRLISIDANGSIVADQSFGKITKNNADDRTDLKGSAITMDGQQNYIVTSTVSLPNAGVNTYTQVSAHDPSTLSLKWSKNYNQDGNYDYQNGKSVQITQSGNIIWATSAIDGNTINSTSFLRVPVVRPDGAPTNGAELGRYESPSAYYSGSDIKGNGVGYGIIGTYQSTTGGGANVFFIQTDQIGNMNNANALFFDGVTSAANQPLASKDKTTSQVQDQGITLTATSDGGFLLAGYTSTTTDGSWGNGGKDVYLIRLDPFGTMLWNKFLGGSGDEVPSSVIATADGGFLISGTATLAGQSSIFLMKTNSKGELKN